MEFLPGYERVETGKVCYHHAFPTNPMFRGVWQARLAFEQVEDTIDEVLEWFDRRGTTDFFWWTDSQTKPKGLIAQLLERGFDGNLIGDPGMVADLHELNEEFRVPEEFTIVKAGTSKTLEDWQGVFSASFDAPTSAGQAWIEATSSAPQSKAPWSLYVGYLEENPVATSMLFPGAGVAGVYAVGTVPEYRRMGFGTAITLHPLLEARGQGYRKAVLYSSIQGVSVYHRLGFRTTENSIGVFVFEFERS
jgi:ribosomal protein S18 acetylase RimI-like enzyme